ncbi:MAG TPA: response regulator [Anaerolineae bacterium]|nr:response regulator [Anaerolineae bacterium]
MEKTHILVVEDDDDARMMYTIMLTSWGYEITEASLGGDGIKKARQRKPDLILLDVMMPDMDGYQVCQELRSDPQFHTVPIIFLTALDATDDRIKGYTLGGDDFLTKGQTDYKELGARIEAALQRTHRIQPSAVKSEKRGTIVGLLSLRGGVGVTTVALNLARQAAIQGAQHVIVVDLAFPVGSVGLWSGITGPRHSVELLSRQAAEIMLPLVENFSVQNVHGFHIIPGPATLTDLGRIRLESVERLLNVLREAGYFVILDLGRATLPLLWQTPAQCDWVAVVTSAEATARMLASVALNTLPKYGVNQQALLLIFNDATGRKPTDISLGLPRSPDVFIPYTKNIEQLPEPSPMAQFWTMVSEPAPEVP